MPFTPYLVFGVATDSGGNLMVGTLITLKNLSSEESITTTTNDLGQYVFDCANFESGWINGDVLQIYTVEPAFEIYASHNGGLSWYQIENEESYTFDINSNRAQINKTYYPGGREVKIIYPI